MSSHSHHRRLRSAASAGWAVALALAASLLSAPPSADAQRSAAPERDSRVGLRAGWNDAGQAARGMELLANRPRPEGFYDAADLGNLLVANSDIAFQGNHLFLGNFSGFHVYDVSDPRRPELRVSVMCPGGQGDVSVHGNLLFMSVEMPNGRIDCGTEGGFSQTASPQRFLGVRIFDISDLERPRQVAAVQTCRGSHTHTLVPDPRDPSHVYIYVAGSMPVRPAAELAGCSGRPPTEDPNTALFRIEVIRVPLAAPQRAEIVSTPRIFADRETGAIAGLWKGGDHGEGTQDTYITDQCHDITVFPEIGLAAGACSGNGILLDISDPANPVRIDEVIDPNFAYWHSATFNNDGTRVIFTDEWGGGMAPRCRSSDRPEWGANALFTLADRKLRHSGYYKLPAPQTATENCVAHNGSLIPVPGRDIMVQAWYQGGISVFDFTDPAHPTEIAFFDRGPLSETTLFLGGHFSAYWYNGHIYASEMSRGLDVLQLLPSEHLSRNELEAAKLVRFGVFNPQTQPKLVWPASFVVARAYLDQLERGGGLERAALTGTTHALDEAERNGDPSRRRAALTSLATRLEGDAPAAGDPQRVQALAGVLRELAATEN